MLAGMSSRQLVEWMAYEQLDGPLGQSRDDYLTAMVMALTANINRGKKGRKHAVSDFLPQWDRSTRTPDSGGSPRKLLDRLVKFTKSRKGTVKGFGPGE